MLCFFPLSGQETEETIVQEAQLARRVCILDATDLSDKSGTSEQAEFREFFYNNLSLELKNAGFELIPRATWEAKQQELGYSELELLDGTKALALASALGADVVIKQFYYLQGDKITFGIKCYDVGTGMLRVESLKEENAGLVVVSSINKFLQEMVPLIKERMRPFAGVGEDQVEEQIVEEIVRRKQFVAKGKLVDLTIQSGDEGAEVELADKAIGTISEGELPLSVQADSTLLLNLSKPGYHTESTLVEIADKPLEYRFAPLMKKAHGGLKLEYSAFQFAGAGIGGRIYFQPDRWGLDILNYPYLQLATDDDGHWVLHDDMNFTFFIYPFVKPSAFFRYNITMGMGVISTFFFRDNLPVFFDMYFDGGGAVELNFPDFVLYFREYGRYMLDFLNIGLLGIQMSPPIGVQFSLGVLLKW